MNQEYRICRICLTHENEETFNNIYDAKSHIPKDIFLVSGIKILEFINYKVPALICTSCMQELSMVIKFRNKCIKSEEYFKECLSEIESLFWNEENQALKLNSISIEYTNVKTEPQDSNVYLLQHDTHENEDLNPVNQDVNSYKSQVKQEIIDAAYAGNSPYCHICNRTFSSMPTFKDHMTIMHSRLDESELLKCPYCIQPFKIRRYLNRHIRSTHKKVPIEDMRFRTTGFIKKNALQPTIETCSIKTVEVKEKKKSFKESVADKKKEIKKSLKKKKRSKQIDVEMKIKKTSDKEQDSEDNIFKKEVAHFKCPHCSKFFRNKQSMGYHVKLKHEYTAKSEKFLCDICGKDFPIKYYLAKHVKGVHLKLRPYSTTKSLALPCSICGRISKNIGSLHAHEKTHKVLTPDEYYYCDKCGCKFKTRGEMSSHIKRLHLYKIVYPCSLCPGRSWKKKYLLERHIKIFHENILEYKCEWCGKEFGEKNRLVAHTRTHTGEQPFHCKWENCNRKFTHRTDLRRHYWGHTGERPYKCTVPNCCRGFMKNSELLAHRNRCHSASEHQVKSFL